MAKFTWILKTVNRKAREFHLVVDGVKMTHDYLYEPRDKLRPTAVFVFAKGFAMERKESLPEAKARLIEMYKQKNNKVTAGIPAKSINTMATKKKTTTKKSPRSKVGVKANGSLKKGYKYVKGGRVVKAKSK